MTLNSKNTPKVVDIEQSRIDQHAADWFAKLRTGQITDDDLHRFQQWLTLNPAHQKAYDAILVFWNDPKLSQTLTAFPLSSVEVDHLHHFPKTYRVGIPLMVASFALAALILQPNLNCFQADYCTGSGEITTIQLSDGSKVTMNSQTAIQVNFQDNVRQINLVEGEAYFEVQHNQNRPFVVEGHYSQTTVVGTRFIVREDKNADTITVNQGVVKVSKKQQEPYVLHINEQINIGEGVSTGIKPVSSATSVAWTKSHLVFDASNLGVVIKEIERYRKGTVIIKNNQLKSLKVSGRFDIRNTDKALEALEQTLPIKLYRLTPWFVLIT